MAMPAGSFMYGMGIVVGVRVSDRLSWVSDPTDHVVLRNGELQLDLTGWLDEPDGTPFSV